ncbi:WYL domain-containing protein [Lampropedia puyangensis]|uniref:WYL domain-containing protein n=1 Tax=Lampropedia puyangensis TaxID=1330072 RepID=A0A4S8FCX3_9BURK|nr:WYL domain-containing protein [Lampropedia puyangensis]THU05197.1 WYL domain-containing protein [Lampropedia puyangensis]
MQERTLHARLNRLEALADRLSDGEVHAVAALAQELQVSERTLARDLDVLREQGWALQSASGKGGGIQIAQRWASGRMTLRSADAIELLMALALSEALGLSQASRHADLRRQLGRSFSPADRNAIARLRKRIRVASPVSVDVQQSVRRRDPTILEVVYSAFVHQTVLAIRYIDGKQTHSERMIEAQYLLLAWPFWYVLAWDLQRQAVRTFRLDRITSASALAQRFQLRSAQPFWASCNEVGIVL